MIHFAHPWVLILIPATLVGFVVWVWRVHKGGSGANWEHIAQMRVGSQGKRRGMYRPRRFRFVFMFLALCLGWTAMARPQWGHKRMKTYQLARDVLIALDLSKSMLAEDVKPSRLERAKLMIYELLHSLRGERVGLLLFSGTSFVQSPLSADYEILRDIIPELNPDYLPQGGTDFGVMLEAAVKAYRLDTPADRFLVVLSDGENLNERWEEPLKRCVENKIRIISLGVGTPEGSVIPDPSGGVVKDSEGIAVLSRLQENILRKLAEESGGKYQQADKWVDVGAMVTEVVDAGRQFGEEEEGGVKWIEQFQIFLGGAIFFLLLSLWGEFPYFPALNENAGKQIREQMSEHEQV